MHDRFLKRWELAGLISLAVIVVAMPLSLLRQPRSQIEPQTASPPAFVGSLSCKGCHQLAWEGWSGSDHDLAMAEATDDTVLGDFDDAEVTHGGITSRFYRRDGKFIVHTEGRGSEMAEFEVAYTFGHEPLQQYLVPFPGGRLQSLSLAWDSRPAEQGGQRWFHLYPDQQIPADDWLHWTRNGQNWNGMCAECHSTNLRKGYDPDSDTYTTTWSEINVGCEGCHGAGSRHVAWAEMSPMARPDLPELGLLVSTRDLSGPELAELCAPCHSRRAELGDYDHTGTEMLDHMLPSLLRNGLYHDDGQILDEVYVYGSFLQSKMYARDVGCSDCHDSHSLELHYQGNQLCLQCHQQEVYDSEGHHFHKKEVEGKPSDGALCVKCHMVEQPYMVIDWRADHSFRLPRPDLSAEMGTPNACTQSGCHADKPLQWSLDAFRKWYGEARRPHFGTTFRAAYEGKPESQEELLRLVRNTLQPTIVRATALELLEPTPGSPAAAAMGELLLDDEPLLRRTAAARLVEPDPQKRASLLAPLLSDPVKAVRLAALSQLAGVPLDLLKSYQRQHFDKVLQEYRESMSHSLDFASSGMNLGNLNANLGKPAEAEYYYRLALKIDDLFFPARMNLAVLLSGQERNEEAERQLRQVIDAYPENPEAPYMLGLLLVEKGRPDEALLLLEQSAKLQPRNARVQYNLGLLYQQVGRDSQARSALESALELDSVNLQFLYALADHHLKRGRFAVGLELAKRIISNHPQQQIGHDLKAFAEQAMAEQQNR